MKKRPTLAAAVPAARAVADEPATPKVSTGPAEARAQEIRPSATLTTDGAGQRENTVPAPTLQLATQVPAPAATQVPAPAAVPVPAARVPLSDRELTFKQGYALRQAALGRPATVVPAPASRKVAEAKPKPRKQRAPVQVYQLPDGRTVVVRRPYGNAPLSARTNPGGFRSAEMRPERFGQAYGQGDPFASRRGLFGGFY